MEDTEAADLHTHGKRKRRIYRERRFGDIALNRMVARPRSAFRDRYRLGCAPGGRHHVYAPWGFPGGSAGRSSPDKSVGEESYSGR
jgi:hypothetical protein